MCIVNLRKHLKMITLEQALQLSVIDQNTTLTEQRLRNLDQLISQSPTAADALEVGCWRGGSSLIIARAMAEYHPGRHVWICDTFQGLVMADPEYDNYHKDGDFAATKEEVDQLLRSAGLTNYTILEGTFPLETGSQLATGEIGFAHVDVDLYRSYQLTLEFIEPRLLPGSIVVFDDYAVPTCEGATLAVNQWLAKINSAKRLDPNTLDLERDTAWIAYQASA